MPAAAAPQGGPAWGELSSGQRAALEPLLRDWPTMDADRKLKWLEVVSRFPSMSPEERQRVQARMTQWARLTPEERGSARQVFQESRRLSPEDRQTRWREYQALTEEQRQDLSRRSDAPVRLRRPEAALDEGKRNIVEPGRAVLVRPVAPTALQAQPGVSTKPVTVTPALPPVHHQPGLPKIAATEGFVDRSTLLPQRGPQGAAASIGSAAASSAR